MKPSRVAVIGNTESVVIPCGRNQTDWGVELGTVLGRTANYVSADDAQDYVFGKMVAMDISERGGRPTSGNPLYSESFVRKGHDTFATHGPWIAPEEFHGKPMQKLRQSLKIGEQKMQEATADDMIHSIWETIEYGTSIITLFPGDVINNGTSGPWEPEPPSEANNASCNLAKSSKPPSKASALSPSTSRAKMPPMALLVRNSLRSTTTDRSSGPT